MKSNGMNDISYDFGEDEELNNKMSSILNEACHVFRHHADGNWKEIYKPKYSGMLAEQITKKPALIKNLLKLKDPAVSNITHAAIEITKAYNNE